jgi:hypothetical protein
LAIASRCLRISSATDSIQAVFSLRSKTDAPNNAGAAGGSWRKTNRTPFPVKRKERMDEIAKKKTGRATKLRFSLVSRKVVELAQHQRFLAFGPSIYSPLIKLILILLYLKTI